MKTKTSFNHAATSRFICAFGFAIIAGCAKEIKSPPDQTKNTAATEANALLADTTPPTVNFIFPTDGDTVFGTITISVNATDNVSVASVECKGDGVSIGTKTASPYNFVGKTRAVMNGAHQLEATAVDASGNVKTQKIIVHVLNPGVIPMEQQLLNLINAERANRGLVVLTFDSRILKAARKHAQDMAYNNFYSHIGSDGSELRDRLDAVGYPYTEAAENIYAGRTRRTATDVYNAWYANPSYRAIMIDPSVREAAVGAGYNFNSLYKNYWVLNVGSTE